jgi:hypothetical protein
VARGLARAAPATLAAVLSGWWVTASGGSGDLAAHLMRAELVRADGVAIWNGQWFGGHHTPAYGALFPQIAALTGVRVAGALSVIAAVVLFERLA